MPVLPMANPELSVAIVSLFWISVAALLAPLLSRATRRYVPEVVLLLVMGWLIGPFFLNWATLDGGVNLVREMGLGLLFLIAGLEITPGTLEGKQGRNASLTWLGCLVLAFVVALTTLHVSVPTAIALGLSLTSTALGALIPILESEGMLDTKLGAAVMTHGAVGELGPVLAMAILLGSRSPWQAVLVLLLFAGVAITVAVLPRELLMRLPGLQVAIREGDTATSQITVRLVFLLLLSLMALASVFSLDVVLGAFAAGFILRRLLPTDGNQIIRDRLNAVGYGFFIPVFFVTSGMTIDAAVILEFPVQLLIMLGAILLTRGLPVYLRERFTDTGSGLTNDTDRVRLGLYAATGLPIIVAVTEVAVAADLLAETTASLLVAAGAITVLIFPLIARLLPDRSTAQAEPVPSS